MLAFDPLRSTKLHSKMHSIIFEILVCLFFFFHFSFVKLGEFGEDFVMI